jgi:uncharacterized protein (DUF2141 family)
MLARLALHGLLAGSPVWAGAAEVTVEVANVPDAAGVVRIGLCTRAEYADAECAYREQLPAERGAVTLTFAEVAPGRYAALAYQDRNDDGVLDRGWFGVPREPYGFSAAPRDGRPPPFTAAARTVHDDGAEFAIRLLGPEDMR